MAEEKKATLIVELVDKASGFIKSMTKDWISYRQAIKDVWNVMTSAIKAFMEEETAVTKLSIALSKTSTDSSNAAQRLSDLANALQRTTTFTDTSIISMQGLLATFGLNEASIARLTPKILDMATATGVDLQTAAMALGKSIATGTTGILTRYGLVVDETAFKQDALGAVCNTLTSRFDGLAEAVGDTMEGKIKILGNRWSELNEKLGDLLSGSAERAIVWVGNLTTYLENNTVAIGSTINWIIFFGETIANVFTYLAQLITTAGFTIFEYFNGFSALLSGDVTGAIDIWKNSFTAAKDSIISDFQGIIDKSAESYNKLKSNNKNLLNDNKVTKTNLLKEEQLFNKADMEERKKRDKELKDLEMKMRKFQVDMREEEKKDKLDTLNYISSLTQAKNKELALIGKAAAISIATIDMFSGIGKAWAFGPILGPPFAAMVGAAGMANIARIAGVELAEGGIVPARFGGIPAILGEGGSAEAVIPLDDDRAKGAIGGDTYNVTINAGVIVADEMAVEEFAEKIDEKLFLLKQSGRTVSI